MNKIYNICPYCERRYKISQGFCQNQECIDRHNKQKSENINFTKENPPLSIFKGTGGGKRIIRDPRSLS